MLCIPEIVTALHDTIFSELMRSYHESKNRRIAKHILSVINQYFILEDTAKKENRPFREGSLFSGGFGRKFDSSCKINSSSAIDESLTLEEDSSVSKSDIRLTPCVDELDIHSKLNEISMMTDDVRSLSPSTIGSEVVDDVSSSNSSQTDIDEISLQSNLFPNQKAVSDHAMKSSQLFVSDESYMLPPPTPSKSNMDSQKNHRDITLKNFNDMADVCTTQSNSNTPLPSVHNKDALEGCIGSPPEDFDRAKMSAFHGIGFSDLLNVANFEHNSKEVQLIVQSLLFGDTYRTPYFVFAYRNVCN